MKIVIKSLYMIALLSMAQSAAACDRPAPVPIPDGLTALDQEMRDASTDAKQFMVDMALYLDCRDAENERTRMSNASADKSTIKRREDQAIRLHNEAAREMENVAAKFRQAVTDYKSMQE